MHAAHNPALPPSLDPCPLTPDPCPLSPVSSWIACPVSGLGDPRCRGQFVRDVLGRLLRVNRNFRQGRYGRHFFLDGAAAYFRVKSIGDPLLNQDVRLVYHGPLVSGTLLPPELTRLAEYILTGEIQ